MNPNSSSSSSLHTENFKCIAKSEINETQWQEAADLIIKGIPNTIISKLGTGFNRIFYKAIAQSQYSCAYAASAHSGRLLGIIIGTIARHDVLKNNFFRLLVAANFRLLRPAVVGWLIKGVLTRFGPKNHRKTHERPAAELLVIAVQPETRGLGVAAALVEQMEKFIKNTLSERQYIILTEKSNTRANKFYEKIGAKFIGTFVHHGREINEWHKFLTKE